MATGIVSVACHLLGLRWIALALLAVNAASYVALVALNVARSVRSGRLRGGGFAWGGGQVSRGAARFLEKPMPVPKYHRCFRPFSRCTIQPACVIQAPL